jgi:hypothetical protein
MYNRRGLQYHLPVPQAVRTILASNNLYFQALSSGITNYTGLVYFQAYEQEYKQSCSFLVSLNVIMLCWWRLLLILFTWF